jgi:hypothetical protein
MGEEMLEEFTLFSLGVPLSKRYFTAATSIALARVLRMSHVLPEFAALTIPEQGPILRSFNSDFVDFTKLHLGFLGFLGFLRICTNFAKLHFGGTFSDKHYQILTDKISSKNYRCNFSEQ